MTKSGNEADIMVVDDTPEIRGFLTNILRKQGYRVRAFDGGRCALAAAAEQPPDLILLDVCMPDMDGYETCERVKVSCHTGPSEVRCLIGASGRGIPADLVPKFFGVFSVNEAITPGGDLGLAPPVAERIISLFGGSVTVESLDPPGIRLTVTLKSATAATATPEAVCVGP